MQGVAAADAGHTDVVGFDVAVSDARAFQQDDRLEQILAEPLEQIEADSTLLTDSLAQCFVASRFEQQGCTIGKRQDAMTANDQRAFELLQHLALAADAVVVVRVDRDLGHEVSSLRTSRAAAVEPVPSLRMTS